MVVDDVRKVLEVISSDWCWLSASLSGPCLRRDLLNWMLATSCEQGHLDVVQLLVQSYDADAKDCAIHSDEFAVINGLPLYAAARAGRETHGNTLQTPSILVYVGDVKLRRLIDLECFCLLSIFFLFFAKVLFCVQQYTLCFNSYLHDVNILWDCLPKRGIRSYKCFISLFYLLLFTHS